MLSLQHWYSDFMPFDHFVFYLEIGCLVLSASMFFKLCNEILSHCHTVYTCFGKCEMWGFDIGAAEDSRHLQCDSMSLGLCLILKHYSPWKHWNFWSNDTVSHPWRTWISNNTNENLRSHVSNSSILTDNVSHQTCSKLCVVFMLNRVHINS